MAVFGAPVAHEDDPERAVRTGLARALAGQEPTAAIEVLEEAIAEAERVEVGHLAESGRSELARI